MRIIQFKVSTRFRIAASVAALFVAVLFTLGGTLSQMDTAEAEIIYAEFENLASQIMGVQGIFLNNFFICLMMFVPVIGPLYAIFVMYSTGRVIAAIAIVRGVDPAALFATTFVFPHAWIEYVAYGLAISQSVWLIVGIPQHRFKAELVTTLKMIMLSALILLLAAIVEMATISVLTG